MVDDTGPSAASGDGPTALTTPPEEDSGAATQDRYRWQHHCTAADALMMLKDPDIRSIVCEMHEDYVVTRDTGQELVSCKHRELSQGAWSLNDLCLNGGVAHLFSRWASLPSVTCRLMTNAGLRSGATGPTAIVSACAEPDCTDFNQCRDSLSRSLLWAGQRKLFLGIPVIPGPRLRAEAIIIPDGFAERVAAFMPALSVKSALAGRLHINDHHVNAVAFPILEASGYDGSLSSSCYKNILEIIRSRNMADALTGEYATWLTRPNVGSRGQLAALVQARTITVEDVRSAIQARRPRNLLKPFPAKGHERLRAKLIAGGVRETRINGATRLREAWLATWAEMRSGLPGDEAERHDVETRVLDVAGDVEARVARSGKNWGDQMYENLRARFDQGAVIPGSTLQLSTAHLMGVAMDLTASCQLWFSEPFDVEAAINTAASVAEVSAETGDRIG